ncbi:uncharacterized protein [Musca autumnalis]|uniref:uncharacterized protein n=1 Tax=Musca autumnalis TaxID=221902 RepID=UPI003CF19F52
MIKMESSDSYVMVGYSLVSIIFALLMIWGVVKRNVYLMIPAFFSLAFGLLYNEDWYKHGLDKRVLGVVGALFFVLNPIFIEMYKIHKENVAKRRRQVTIYG